MCTYVPRKYYCLFLVLFPVSHFDRSPDTMGAKTFPGGFTIPMSCGCAAGHGYHLMYIETDVRSVFYLRSCDSPHPLSPPLKRRVIEERQRLVGHGYRLLHAVYIFVRSRD